MSEKNRVLIAYHADCLDGFTAAWITYRAMKAQGKECELLAMEYTRKSEDELCTKLMIGYTPSVLYVVDFSLKVDLLLSIHENRPDLSITILDHHKTAFEMYCPGKRVGKYTAMILELHGAKIILDNDHSGAGLCNMHFNQSKENVLVNYVEDYDLFLFTYGPATKYINKYLMQYEKTLANWDFLNKQFSDPDSFSVALRRGKALQIDHDIEVGIIAKEAIPIIIKGEEGLVVACPREYISDVGHALAAQCGTYGAMYILDMEKGKITWSFRSSKEGDYDVEVLAKKLGGGGHKTSAGVILDLWDENGEKIESIIDSESRVI